VSLPRGRSSEPPRGRLDDRAREGAGIGVAARVAGMVVRSCGFVMLPGLERCDVARRASLELVRMQAVMPMVVKQEQSGCGGGAQEHGRQDEQQRPPRAIGCTTAWMLVHAAGHDHSGIPRMLGEHNDGMPRPWGCSEADPGWIRVAPPRQAGTRSRAFSPRLVGEVYWSG